MGKRATRTIAERVDTELLQSLFHLPLAQARQSPSDHVACHGARTALPILICHLAASRTILALTSHGDE